MAGALFPESAQPLANYRKLVVGINKRLGTVEILMAGGEWSRISPGSVPSQCLNLHRNAFLNTNPSKRAQTTASTNDRIQCASNFTQHALLAVSDPSKANVHGRVLHPHKMVKPYMHHAAQDDVILEAQWTDLRERLREINAQSREDDTHLRCVRLYGRPTDGGGDRSWVANQRGWCNSKSVHHFLFCPEMARD